MSGIDKSVDSQDNNEDTQPMQGLSEAFEMLFNTLGGTISEGNIQRKPPVCWFYVKNGYCDRRCGNRFHPKEAERQYLYSKKYGF